MLFRARLNYEGLPASYEDVVLFAESLEEVMADKLEALACSKLPRYRDIWDLHWLVRQPGIDLGEACALRKRKEADYRESEIFVKEAPRLVSDLATIVEGNEFAKQMRRFLPVDQFERTIARPAFCAALTEGVRELYARCGVHE